MAFRIIWSPRASNHFEEICEYISIDSQTYASIFAKNVFKVVENIQLFPKSGRKVPEYNDENL